MEEVGLAQAHAGVYEQGVVGAAGCLSHGPSGAVRKAVGCADDELAEGVVGVEDPRSWTRWDIWVRCRSYLAWPFSCWRGLRPYLEPDVHGMAHDPARGGDDGLVHTALQPLDSEGRGYPHVQKIIREGDRLGIPEPCFVDRSGNL